MRRLSAELALAFALITGVGSPPLAARDLVYVLLIPVTWVGMTLFPDGPGRHPPKPPVSTAVLRALSSAEALTPRVDRYARVTVRQCHYSVQARLIGHRVRAVLRASRCWCSTAARFSPAMNGRPCGAPRP